MPRTPVPVEITQEQRTLIIVWDDGHRGRHAFRTLRERCPCAFCIDEVSGEGRLDPRSIPADIHPREVGRVGAYALRFTWSDGHLTGIYPFAFLRKICECDACAETRGSNPSSSA